MWAGMRGVCLAKCLLFAELFLRSGLVTYNVLGVWRSGFDLEAGTVNLAQN
jgi:hypothetical protein